MPYGKKLSNFGGACLMFPSFCKREKYLFFILFLAKAFFQVVQEAPI